MSGRDRRWALCVLLALACAVLPAAPASAKRSSRELVDLFATEEGHHLGESLPGGPEKFIQVVESPKRSIVVHEYGETFTAGAVTDPIWSSSGSEETGAKITIFGISRSKGEAVYKGVIAHEVFHVFEARLAGTEAADAALPAWLVEGAADWVASYLVAGSSLLRGFWKEYLDSPTTELFKRSYDAIGFFGHMYSSGISPWKRFKAMFTAGSSSAAWSAAVGGQTGYLDSEASSFFRESRLGGEWEQTGSNVPSAGEARAKPVAVTVPTTGKPVPLTAKPYADGIYDVSIASSSPTPSKPAVEVVLSRGNARIAATAGGHLNEAITGPILLCSDPKGCSTRDCPKHYVPFERGDIAVTGGASGGVVTLTRRKPCESQQPLASCETLLPGFTTETSVAIGKTVGSPGGLLKTVTTPSGSSVSECLFLAKGTVDAEGNFRGAIGFAMTLRAPTVAGAQAFFSIIERTSGLVPITGYGEAAVLMTSSTVGAEGTEYDSEAAVRVGNEVAFYGVYSTPGNEEAAPGPARALLRIVAGEI